MNKQDKEKLRKIWSSRVKDYENSGLTMKDWCEKNDVKVHQLQYWRKRFNNQNNKKINLVPVNLNNNDNEIRYIKLTVGKLGLEINPGFNPLLLKEILKVLMELC